MKVLLSDTITALIGLSRREQKMAANGKEKCCFGLGFPECASGGAWPEPSCYLLHPTQLSGAVATQQDTAAQGLPRAMICSPGKASLCTRDGR